MLLKVLRTAITLAFVLISQMAQAFFDLPTLSPTNPMEGQAISVHITGGGCDTLVEKTGYPQITQTGNAIRFLAPSVHSDFSDFCIYPVGTATYVIGTYPVGSYTVQVDRSYIPFGGPIPVVVETLGTLPFIVAAAPAALPANGVFVLLTLITTTLLIGIVALRRRRLGLLIVAMLACLPLISHAQSQYIHVLLSGAPGAPTPAQVVNYYSFSPPPPGGLPLQGLAVENPQKTYFLMPTRASGDFLTYLQANPNSVRSKLERYVIVRYLPSADIANALSALRSDPNVDAAFPAATAKFSSVQLLGFRVGDPAPALAPLASGTQYGRDDLNVDAAWLIYRCLICRLLPLQVL